MPTYDFTCPKHGKFEMNKPIAKRDGAVCPICSAISPRAFSVPAVHYRGSGFFATDKGILDPENPLDTMD